MLWNGKITGVFLGAIFGGPYGALIGITLGHLFDIGLFDRWLQRIGFTRGTSRQTNIQQIFFNSTFTIMGYLAKSDGRVSENEIRLARRVMDQFGLNAAMKREAIQLFTKGKQPNFDVNSLLAQLKQACLHHPTLLRTFLEIQLQMAYADGQKISAQKRQAFEFICSQLGISHFNFNHFEQRYRAEQNYQQYRQQPRQSPRQHLHDAYKILDVSSTTSNADVKKAYRRMMSKNHPDKLIAKGLPPEMIKVATQKTQQIKSAYETIKKSRNL